MEMLEGVLPEKRNLKKPIPLSETEKVQFEYALKRFTVHNRSSKGITFSYDETREDPEQDTKDKPRPILLRDISEKNVDIGFVTHSESEGWSDHYFGFLFSKLPDNEKDDVVNAMRTNNLRILRLSRKSSGNEEARKMNNYIELHGGSIFLAQHDLVSNIGNPGTNVRVRERRSSKTSQERSREEILSNNAGKSIRFYGLTREPETAYNPRDLLEGINELSDFYEVGFDIALTLNKIIRDKNKLAAVGVPSSLLFEQVLENLPVDEQAKQVISMAYGEVVAMGIAGADRISEFMTNIKKKEALLTKDTRKYLGIAGQSMKNLPPDMKSKVIGDARKFDVSWKRTVSRTGVLGMTVGISMALSEFSKQQNSLWPYAILPFLNTLIVTMYELGERAVEYKHMNYTEEQKQKIREEIPRILRPLIGNSTPLAVAILNLKDNKYAMGSIAGAALASLSVLPIDVLVDFFHANKAWVYAAAGSGIETTASFIWGKVQTNKDAYKEFTKQFKQKPSVE